MKRRWFIELIGSMEHDGLVIAPRLQQKKPDTRYAMNQPQAVVL